MDLGGIINGILNFLVIIVFIVLIVIIVYLVYLYLRKKEFQFYYPRQDFYDGEKYSLEILPLPFLKDLIMVSEKMPEIRIGRIISAKIEANDFSIQNAIDLTKIEADTIITFLVQIDNSLFRKIKPEKKIFKILRRQIQNDFLAGDIIVKGTGIKVIGHFLTIIDKDSNTEKLLLPYLEHQALIMSFEKAQDKWGQFALANIGQREAYLMGKEREKINIDLPFLKKKEK